MYEKYVMEAVQFDVSDVFAGVGDGSGNMGEEVEFEEGEEQGRSSSVSLDD